PDRHDVSAARAKMSSSRKLQRGETHGSEESTGQEGSGKEGSGKEGSGKEGTGKEGTRKEGFGAQASARQEGDACPVQELHLQRRAVEGHRAGLAACLLYIVARVR